MSWWIWLLILLIIILLWILKRVIVVAVTVTVDKADYYRGETVQISGSVKRGVSGQSGKTVALAIAPPEGDVYNLPNVTTDAQGNFNSSWVVPIDAEDGLHTLTATSLGVSATKTFTRIQRR